MRIIHKNTNLRITEVLVFFKKHYSNLRKIIPGSVGSLPVKGIEKTINGKKNMFYVEEELASILREALESL